MKKSTVLKNTIGTTVGIVHTFFIDITILSYISYSTIKHNLPIELFMFFLIFREFVEFFVSPFIGKISDLTKTFVGRRGPYILLFGLVLSFSASLLQVSLINQNVKIYTLGLMLFVVSSSFLKEMIYSFRNDIHFNKISKVSIKKIISPSYFLIYILFSVLNTEKLLPILSLINLLISIFIFFIIYEDKKYKSKLFESEPSRPYKANVSEKILVIKNNFSSLKSFVENLFNDLVRVNIIVLQILTPILFYRLDYPYKISTLLLSLMFLIFWLRMSRNSNVVRLNNLLLSVVISLLFLTALVFIPKIGFFPSSIITLIFSPIIYILIGYYYAIIVTKYDFVEERLRPTEQVILISYLLLLSIVYYLFKVEGTIFLFSIINLFNYLLILRGEEVDKKR